MTDLDTEADKARRRLYKLARERGLLFDHVLRRYANERLLHRLTTLPWSIDITLRGAWAIEARLGVPHRRWSTVQLRSPRPVDHGEIAALINEVSGYSKDGLLVYGYDLRMRTPPLDLVHGRVQVKMFAYLGTAQIPVQVEIGFDDPMVPAAEVMESPTLLDMAAPSIPVYVFETLVAEKLQGIVERGTFKVRMKDYYDLWLIAQVDPLDDLDDAIEATFRHRKTAVPDGVPPGLTDGFAASDHAQRLWDEFLERGAPAESPAFGDVVAGVREAVMPVFEEACWEVGR